MDAYVEVWETALPQAVALTRNRMTLGKSPGNDIALSDPAVSRLHAAIERFGEGWCVIDLGSRNGTRVNGEQIMGPRALRPGDEVHVGGIRLVFRRDDVSGGVSSTQAAQPAPDLTPREHDVLCALCGPVLSRDLLTAPASIRDIAEQLTVTQGAVKKHLTRLYDKFDVYESPRGARLASEAIRRGAVTVGDLRAADGNRHRHR